MRRCIFSIVSVSPRWPCTWAQPVMPGLTLWRRDNGEIRSANASLRAIGCGRGPNNRHFAQQYIHQLGKLVDIRAPQNTTNAHHRAHQGDRGRKPIGGSARRWNSGGSHGRASAHFQSIRMSGQQLGGVVFGLEDKDVMLCADGPLESHEDRESLSVEWVC